MKIYQVDAFTTKVFAGNPAAVVPLEHWLDDYILQAIAAENNLAETAFTVPCGESWELRWFTPTAEVALCGHATLAAAYVLLKHQGCEKSTLEFITKQSGKLIVECLEDGSLSMSFPAIPIVECNQKSTVGEALGAIPKTVLSGRYSPDQFDYVAVFESEESVSALNPDFRKFRTLDSRGVIATASGNSYDFVSRYFAPNFGIDEDPVTGSAHCLLPPYWSQISDKQDMRARQLSRRGGDLACTMAKNNRVLLAGHAVDYLVGEINI